MFRSAVVLLLLLMPGCFFDDFDSGCPGRITVISTWVTQELSGDWDISRARMAFNTTTVGSYSEGEYIFGNLSDDYDGVSVWVSAATQDLTAPNATARSVMTFPWSRCEAADETDRVIQRDEERFGKQWTDWRDAFLSATELRAAAPPTWTLRICAENEPC